MFFPSLGDKTELKLVKGLREMKYMGKEGKGKRDQEGTALLSQLQAIMYSPGDMEGWFEWKIHM